MKERTAPLWLETQQGILKKFWPPAQNARGQRVADKAKEKWIAEKGHRDLDRAICEEEEVVGDNEGEVDCATQQLNGRTGRGDMRWPALG